MAIDEWKLDREADRAFVVRINPRRLSTGETELFRFSTMNLTDDTVDDFRPLIRDGLSFSQRLSSDLFGGTTRNAGFVLIDNSTGEFDTFLDSFVWGGEQITVQGLDPFFRFSYGGYRYYTLFSGLMLSAQAPNQSTIRIDFTSEAGTANTDIFGATGQGETLWPIVYGQVLNVTGKPYTDATVSDTNRIYKISRYPVEGIDAVFVAAVAQTPTSDYADLAALVTAQASLVAGEYATCLNEGLFAVHGDASGTVTCDIRGRNDMTGGYQDTAGPIINAIASESAPPNGGKFPSFPTLDVYPDSTLKIGFFLDSSINVQDVIEQISQSIGGVNYWDERSQMLAEIFTGPEDSESQGEITETLDIMGSMSIQLWRAPTFKVVLEYARNYTVQGGDGLPAVVDRPRSFLIEEWSSASAANMFIADAFADARKEEDQTMMQHRPEVFGEAARRLALFQKQRFIYKLRSWNRSGAYRVMDTWTLVHSRYAPSGKKLKIIGVTDNFTKQYTDLELWG